MFLRSTAITPVTKLYKDAHEARELHLGVRQEGETLSHSQSWEALGIKTVEGRQAFEDEYYKKQPFGVEHLNDGLNPYESWLHDHDPVNLGKLETTLGMLEDLGYAPELWELTTPHMVKGAVDTIGGTQEGFVYWLEPYLMTGLKPVILQESIDGIHDSYKKSLAKLDAKYQPDTVVYGVANRVLEEEYKRALDIDGALAKLDAMIDLGLEIRVPDVSDEHQHLVDSANATLENIRHAYARTQVPEDYFTDEVEGPFNVVLSGAVGAAALGALGHVPGTPDWLLQSLAGYMDDVAALGALIMSTNNMTKVQLAEQCVVAAIALAGCTELSTFIDSLSASGSEPKLLAAGSIFALAALGVAAAGNAMIGMQNGKKLRELAQEYKLPGHMPIPEELRPRIAACKSLAEAKALIEAEKESWELEAAQSENITQKLERITDDETWLEQLQQLTTLAKHPKWDSFKQAINENPLQRLLFLAQGLTVAIDVELAPILRHDPAALALLGSTEGVMAFALYIAHKHQIVSKSQAYITKLVAGHRQQQSSNAN